MPEPITKQRKSCSMMLWVGNVCSCTLCGVLLSSLWPCSVHKHPCLRVPEDIAQYQQKILSEPGVSSQETKRLWEGRCVQKHQDLARTGRNGPSKHRERLLASSPYSNNDHGIGITKSLFNAGILTFLYRPFVYVWTGGFLERWSKEFVWLWKEYVCPVKNH